MKYFLSLALLFSVSWLAQQQSASNVVSTQQFSNEVTNFLGRELGAHVSDVHSLDPPQERVLGALTTGDFSWGTFMRALASFSVLSGQRTVAGTDLTKLIGKIGLIESRHGGKTFAQLYAGIALRSFGSDLRTNTLWL
ncbi:MAG TPA: hypothetical protein VKE71_03530, partial [Candidatus Angelobacter sp.]|nr:hypothetical protein [Candidatus Angelobacter sp.]